MEASQCSDDVITHNDVTTDGVMTSRDHDVICLQSCDQTDRASRDVPPEIIVADYQLATPTPAAASDDVIGRPLIDGDTATSTNVDNELGANATWNGSGTTDGVLVCTEDPDITFGDPIVTTTTHVVSGTNVDAATVPPSTVGDNVGEVDWRQSNSFESHGSSAGSVDTIQSVKRQQDTSLDAQTALTGQAAAGDEDQSTITMTAPDNQQLMSSCVENGAESIEQPETKEIVVEMPQTDFTTGIMCHDVPTALDILNTRYRLADVTIHKNMITWSSWNIADMVRGPHRDSFWWKGKRRGKYPLRSVDSVDKGETPSTPKQNGSDISVKDIEVLCEKIEMKEREIELMLCKDEQRQLAATSDMPVSEEAVTLETVPVTSSAPPGGGDTKQVKPQQQQQQKHENVFQRLLRALRRRFSRQQQPQEQPEQLATQEQRAGSRRLRTL